MSIFRKVLTVLSYVGVAGAPIVASTGVGLPVAGVLGAVGVAAGAWLHWSDSPSATTVPIGQTIDAVKAVQSAVRK